MHILNGGEIRHDRAFSLLELITVLFVFGCIFVFFALQPISRPRATAPRIKCVNNLKNVGLAYSIYASDNGERFPWQTTNSASMQKTQWTALDNLLAVTNELSTPHIVICPADTRKEAANWNSCTPSNISYFICIDSALSVPDSFLAGDRNLMTNGVLFTQARAKIPPSAELSWTKDIHQNQGNICMGDGSVQQLSNTRLRNSWRQFSSDTTNNPPPTFLFPY